MTDFDGDSRPTSRPRTVRRIARRTAAGSVALLTASLLLLGAIPAHADDAPPAVPETTPTAPAAAPAPEAPESAPPAAPTTDVPATAPAAPPTETDTAPPPAPSPAASAPAAAPSPVASPASTDPSAAPSSSPAPSPSPESDAPAAPAPAQRQVVAIPKPIPNSDATLSKLRLPGVGLDQKFDPADTTYTSSVDATTESVTVKPTASAGSLSKITVNKVNVPSGEVSDPIALTAGVVTRIRIVVTAQSGATEVYVIKVTRAALSQVATLSGLTSSAGTLSPAFASDQLAYSQSVPATVGSVTLTATTTDATATLTVNGVTTTSGSASTAITLGTSTSIPVVVTAQDGTTTASYTVTVTQQPVIVIPPLIPIAWTDSTLAGFTVGSAYRDGVSATGFAPISYRVSAGALPDGIALDGSGAVTGTPTTAGAYSFEITASGIIGSVRQTFSGYVQDVTATAVTPGFAAGDPTDGAAFTASAGGLEPGSTFTVELHSTPMLLFSSTVGASGSVRQVLTLPANTPVGSHALIVSGTGANGSPVTSTVWFTALSSGRIGAVSSTGPLTMPIETTAASAVLASTGVGTGEFAPALVALAIGLLLVAIRRRPRSR